MSCEMLQSLTKSHKKADHMLIKASDRYPNVFKNACAVRPLILKVLRFYPDLKKTPKYTEYLQVTYNKCKDWIVKIGPEIERLESAAAWSPVYQHQAEYLKKFQKNLKKIKKLCEESSISYYNSLPGYKVPLEIRGHIVGFISQAPME